MVEHLIRPPAYGSPEWRQLPDDHPHRQAALVHAAECWRLLCTSPHIADLLAEFAEWVERRDLSASTAAMSAMRDRWVKGPTFAELQRRRSTYDTPALTPSEIRAQARASWAEVDTRGKAA